MNAPIKLTGELIEAFAGTFLSPRYDNAAPTPKFHREVWNLYASDNVSCGAVAPRDHAKSTAFTFDYILAEVCFRRSDYVILIGSTEDKAVEQLSNISDELHNNEDLRREFGIIGFESDQKTEIIVKCDDAYRFRIIARGAEQKIRGAMWKGKRPNLIVCDDMEDDEQVENKDRRSKFRRWFFRAAKQALSKSGKIRVHGTILHEDSLLSRLLKNKAWKFLFYKAHTSYDDFSNLLWPERWTVDQLRAKRLEFEEDGDAGGYSQEFLNDPLDRTDAFLRREQFLPMSEDERDEQKQILVAADFAVAKGDMSNRTSFTVGGRLLGGTCCIVDQRVGRWDTLEWIAEMFTIHLRWNEEVFFVEDGVIWKSVWPMIRNEMYGATRSPALVEQFGDDDIFINFELCKPVKDKATRGRALQRRMKSGAMHFDKTASWYPGYEDELLKFTGIGEAKLDDQFDSTAWLAIGLDRLPSLDEDDLDQTDEDEDFLLYQQQTGSGRSRQTGY